MTNTNDIATLIETTLTELEQIDGGGYAEGDCTGILDKIWPRDPDAPPYFRPFGF